MVVIMTAKQSILMKSYNEDQIAARIQYGVGSLNRLDIQTFMLDAYVHRR